MDERITKLAKTLVNYSVRLQKGEKILIMAMGLESTALVRQLVKESYAVGGLPFLKIHATQIDRELYLNATKEQFELLAEVDSKLMAEMDCVINIVANQNACEFYDIPHENMQLRSVLYREPVYTKILLQKKWVTLEYPTNSMAQLAKSSLEDFENFYFNVCNLDYQKMSNAMDALVTLMEQTDQVRIVGNGTDLSFSIKGIPVVKCDGDKNIPDGEVYTAPVKDSVNGHIKYNTPSSYNGFSYENVCLTFKDGRIIEATANDTERINKIFDTDEGARYIGEFAIGVNPYIIKPMNNILFDEKIMGSFHFTPGNSYEEASNTNKSAVHWDLVCIQTEEYGGGEIYFDDVLIRKDGIFVLDSLKDLNAENLK